MAFALQREEEGAPLLEFQAHDLLKLMRAAYASFLPSDPPQAAAAATSKRPKRGAGAGGARGGGGAGDKGSGKKRLRTEANDASGRDDTWTTTSSRGAPGGKGGTSRPVDQLLRDDCFDVCPLYEMVLGGGSSLARPPPARPHYSALAGHTVVIRRHDGTDEALEELRPDFVVVLDPDISITRSLEVYHSDTGRKSSAGFRVYFATYTDSVEEQRYMSELRRETEAFQSLISTKAAMVVSANQDGKSGDVVVVAPDAPVPASSRKAGAGARRRTQVPPSLSSLSLQIVDHT